MDAPRRRFVGSVAIIAVAVTLLSLGAVLGAQDDSIPPWAAATLAVSSLIAAMAAVATAIVEFRAGRTAQDHHSEALTLEQRLRTLEYCSAQLERGPVQTARRFIAETADLDGTALASAMTADASLRESLIQLAHSCNRIGAGLRIGALNRDVVDGLWTEAWFRRQWDAVELAIGEPSEGSAPRYADFQRLAGVLADP